MFTNTQNADVLLAVYQESNANQRMLAEKTGYSLGSVNKSLKALISDGYLTKDLQLTAKARDILEESRPRNAIILAAGFGMRMAPINLSTPKGLIEVNKEPLIERQIRQLREAGVQDITIVVGFLKESFDYLIDEYGVELLYNPDYKEKNNLSSLALAVDRISDTYILPSDIWNRTNPYRSYELYSWYMVCDSLDEESYVRVNRMRGLVTVQEQEQGNRMTEIAYISKEDADEIKKRIRVMAANPVHDKDFWENALIEKDKMIISARVVRNADCVEINTYEQLRELDSQSDQLRSDAIDTIAEVFGTTTDKITDIQVLKKGMTNRSFLFSVGGNKYIMRIPGEGTDQLIDRQHEAEVYRTISGLGICDDPVYINPDNGYKITKFLEGIRVADPLDPEDLVKCMRKLREFHEMKLKVGHEFDIFERISYYQSLWKGRKSIYKDHELVSRQVFSLRRFIESQEREYCLTHIDAVPDNFLFYNANSSDPENRSDTKDGQTELQLTDWEYAGMQDPHVDLAMWCVYSYYNKEQADRLIDIYFEGDCDKNTRAKIYCYIAAAGLLWSNWCEYKAILGVEFGEYAMKQYRYAKDFCRYAVAIMDDFL